MRLAVVGGRVIDPSSGFDGRANVVIRDGRIEAVTINPVKSDWEINAEGWYVFPGLVDLHTHLRTPGEEYKEDLESGGQAAARGGFTTLCCMPNTKPPLDSAEIIANLLKLAQEKCAVNVLAFGALVKNDKQLSDMASLLRAGAVGLSDDGFSIQDAELAWLAFREAAREEALLTLHSEDLRLKQYSPVSEEIMIARNLLFAHQTGARLHLCHVSTAGAVALIRWAKEHGTEVTVEACPHHLLLTEECVGKWGTIAKVSPPLRSEEDQQALLDGLRDGTIDAIATDHAPHSQKEKEGAWENAPAGIAGLETTLPLAYSKLGLSISRLVELLSATPAKILGLSQKGNFRGGSEADLTIFDPQIRTKIDPSQFLSKAKFSPFAGEEVQGEVLGTFVKGRAVYLSPALKTQSSGYPAVVAESLGEKGRID